MKASRLLHLLLLLQTRQRITTGELAERLEVSRRTVLRDVEALSAAGVPVYAERGRNGGIVLLPGARLNASHLDPPELEALSVAGLDSAQLERLGLSAVWESATRKIAARQVATPRTRIRCDWPSWCWWTALPGSPNQPQRSISPVSPRPCVTDAGCGSGTAALRQHTERQGRVSITFRLPTNRFDLAKRILGTRIREVSDADQGFCTAVVGYPDLESVRQLLQFGDHIEILAPEAARTRIRQLAEELVRRHSAPLS